MMLNEVLGGKSSYLGTLISTTCSHLSLTASGLTPTRTWLDDITHDSSEGYRLKSSPSNLPYVKISKEMGEDIALFELKFFEGILKDRLVKVRLT
jgi:hypothetical protein